VRTLEKTTEFVNSVLKLAPKVAVFDCDGTLWSGDAGAEFFYWEIENGLIAKDLATRAVRRYNDYKAGKVDEETMCGEMVTIHRGIPEKEIRKAAADFFAQHISPRTFPEMQELTHSLAALGCKLWAVSSTNNWLVTEGARRFGIAEENVIATCVHIETNCATDRLIRVPTGEGKAGAIREVIGRNVDVAFGNSVYDAAMLSIARRAFAINPNPDLETLAKKNRWTIYHPKPLGV
jgi:phosphoserine phosphatase